MECGDRRFFIYIYNRYKLIVPLNKRCDNSLAHGFDGEHGTEMAAVSVMKKRLTFKSRFSRSALRFVSRTRASIFRWNFSEGWKSSFISSKLGIRASSQSCASVTIIAIRASGEIRILSSFITIFLQSGQNDFTRSVQTNFYISGRNVEKIGNLADLVALNF